MSDDRDVRGERGHSAEASTSLSAGTDLPRKILPAERERRRGEPGVRLYFLPPPPPLDESVGLSWEAREGAEGGWEQEQLSRGGALRTDRVVNSWNLLSGWKFLDSLLRCVGRCGRGRRLFRGRKGSHLEKRL